MDVLHATVDANKELLFLRVFVVHKALTNIISELKRAKPMLISKKDGVNEVLPDDSFMTGLKR